MDTLPAAPASQLIEANDRLLKLRAEFQARRTPTQEGGAVLAAVPAGHLTGVGTPVDQSVSRLTQEAASLPAHLGWESQPLMAALRRGRLPLQASGVAAPPAAQTAVNPVKDAPKNRLESANRTVTSKPGAGEIKLYPDIGLGMLRLEEAASGRLWLILRFLDKEGSGKLRVDIIRDKLTTKTSNLYLCGKRQLRNLLRDGEGLFWTRDKTHVWLHSAARVAHMLGVARLTGQPVALPVSALLEGIGAFRAHLYAAFHSGRVRAGSGAAKGSPPDTRAMPIARDTLTSLSGAGRSSQRAYEARLRLHPQANFAVGATTSETNKEERAWHQGQALFELRDYRGEQGKQGKSYLAWQLPNSYGGQHQQRPKGRQKRINRQLRDLVMKGMPGNDGDAGDGRRPVLAVTQKRYYANGRLAGQARRSHETDVQRLCYWRQPGAGNGRSAIWRSMGQP